MLLETLREELIKDISKALDENIHVHGQHLTSNLITQIIVDSFDEYECENKVGVYDGNLFENPENWKKIR